MLIDHLSHYCFIYCVVIFISIRISLFLQNQVFLFSLEKLEGDSKSNQGKVDEKNTAEYIDPGNIEPNTEGTVMIVRLHNQMKYEKALLILHQFQQYYLNSRPETLSEQDFKK